MIFERKHEKLAPAHVFIQRLAACVAIAGLLAAFALLLEKRERLSLLWWLFFQRFCYRQLMYWVMIKSVTTAARGALIGWGKLERKATAEAQT